MSRQLSFTDYDGFVEKFKPKKTTDDCYTPPAPTNPIWNQQGVTIGLNKIYNEDCLEGMKRIPDRGVDMILCDLPYGTTQLKWDIRLPFDKLWEQWLRVCKPNAAIVLFSSQPFTTDLINSNRKMFKYEIIWKKTQRTGFFDAKKRPLRLHENILLFYSKQPTYNPQKVIKDNAVGVGRRRGNSDFMKTNGGFVGKVGKEKAETYYYEEKGWRYPTDVIEFSNWNGALFGNTDRSVKHPTQKPVAICEYLIKTFSNEGDVVLDSCMGSGTTAVAAVNTGRNFIGFETDSEYCRVANEELNRQFIILGKSKDDERRKPPTTAASSASTIPRRRSKLHHNRVSVYKNYYNYRICLSESDNFKWLGFNGLYYYYYNYYNYYIYLHVIRGLKNERKLEKISIFIIIE